jgi:hypothetical protein
MCFKVDPSSPGISLNTGAIGTFLSPNGTAEVSVRHLEYDNLEFGGKAEEIPIFK